MEKPVLTAAGPSRWSDLESTDYRVYIANLRRFGCPEQTLRDIICADVASLYAAKRQEFHLGGRTTAGAWSTEEERRLTAFLLGEMPPDPGDTSQPAITPVVPLVLQKVDLTALGLNEDQKAAVEDLRNQFLNEIGGTDQNPSDPAYAERWRKAQPENDAMLRGMIGVSAFMRYQNEAE